MQKEKAEQKMHLIAVVGGKRSGKTTAVEALVRGLVKHGYKVATVKHVSQKNFTIDTRGKDTWRHAKAGATITTTVSSNEMAIIRKGDTSCYRINDIIKTFENEVDVIIFEGFRKLVGQKKGIPKVVAVKTAEALEMSKQFKPIVAFVGPFNTKDLDFSAPYIDVLTNPEKLVRLVLDMIES
jgi:molybdopterin-guanine dinucleotide biosynthesis protein MobB